MHVGVLVELEFNLSALDIGNSFAHIRSHGASLGVWHQATRTQDLTECSNLAHELRGRHSCVKVGVATGDLLNQFVASDLIGASCQRSLRGGASCEHEDASNLSGSVGQADGATHHLVCFALVDTKLDSHLDGGIKLGRAGLLGQCYGVAWGVEVALGDQGLSRCICLRFCCHCVSPITRVRGI